jgi:hypothetical protein
MADQQPGDQPPAAGTPDPTRHDDGTTEPSTVDAPARWSGSAAVPEPGAKKSRNARRQARLAHDASSAGPDAADDWATMPPVDPWADQATPWDAFPLATEHPLPPTRVEPPMPPIKAEQPPQPPQPAMPAPAPAATPQPVTPQPIAARQPETTLPPPPPPPTGPPPTAGPPQPPAPSKKSRKRSKKEKASANRLPVQPTRPGGPLPAPPPWVQPKVQRPLPPPPKKRRWGRRLVLLGLLGVVCCCGAPFAYFQFPAARQYPVTAVLPRSFADLQRRDDDASQRAAERLAEQLRGSTANTDGVFTGVYGDGRGKRVTVFGVTGFRFAPANDVRSQLNRVADDVELSGVQSFDLGETGAHERCGAGRVDDISVVVCAWADHGSLATVLLTRRSIDDSAALVAQLRNAVLTPGP